MTLKIPISVPPPALRANGSRGSTFVAREARRNQRKEASIAAQVVMETAGVTPPRWERASYRIIAHLKREWDEDNLIASLKGVFDGLKDAWVIKDDKALRHVGTQFTRAQGSPFIIIELAGPGEERQ
jgi:Holliday junction resolvase RusA-like endonuclease